MHQLPAGLWTDVLTRFNANGTPLDDLSMLAMAPQELPQHVRRAALAVFHRLGFDIEAELVLTADAPALEQMIRRCATMLAGTRRSDELYVSRTYLLLEISNRLCDKDTKPTAYGRYRLEKLVNMFQKRFNVPMTRPVFQRMHRRALELHQETLRFDGRGLLDFLPATWKQQLRLREWTETGDRDALYRAFRGIRRVTGRFMHSDEFIEDLLVKLEARRQKREDRMAALATLIHQLAGSSQHLAVICDTPRGQLVAAKTTDDL